MVILYPRLFKVFAHWRFYPYLVPNYMSAKFLFWHQRWIFYLGSRMIGKGNSLSWLPYLRRDSLYLKLKIAGFCSKSLMPHTHCKKSTSSDPKPCILYYLCFVIGSMPNLKDYWWKNNFPLGSFLISTSIWNFHCEEKWQVTYMCKFMF